MVQEVQNMKYRCSECKGTKVQLSFPVWVNANDIDDQTQWDMDVEAQPEKDSDKSWCADCDSNVLLERVEDES